MQQHITSAEEYLRVFVSYSDPRDRLTTRNTGGYDSLVGVVDRGIPSGTSLDGAII
jgi:hypothetical protein